MSHIDDTPVFPRDSIRAFRFVRCTFDAATGVARLVYAFDDGPELVGDDAVDDTR